MNMDILSGKKKPTGKRRLISIKPANRGKLRAETGTKKGAKIPLAKEEALKSEGTPAERKRANFAINARKWNKE